MLNKQCKVKANDKGNTAEEGNQSMLEEHCAH